MLGSGVEIHRPTEPGFLMLATTVGEVAYILLAIIMWHSNSWELPNMGALHETCLHAIR